MSREKRLFALRGATQCVNQGDDIVAQVGALYEGLLSENKLQEQDIVSIIFSVTPDLDAKNPAAALRQGGRAGDLALFALQEAAALNSLERTIRVMIHCYLDEGSTPRHVYRNGAEALRPDRIK
ncbi:chorismate mutase [Treponema primitia ZAS-2]|uniref:chorismate mutase n=1 Tax=Treponema primitia (strain ATCC BAA-887 / DSM 12427 / ZAS-2) TaxID=545694 RepID=F5YHG3_TREPZ|nr:chorismate mutase [Treponema primitia]AEF86277.1 chorismate mutase [Treponema primitia ZAS-2]